MRRSAGGDFLITTAEDAMRSASLLASLIKRAPFVLKSTPVHLWLKWYLFCTCTSAIFRLMQVHA